MITPNTTATTPPKREEIADRHVLCDVTDPTGSTQRECLLTVLNRLSAIGYDRWETRQRLNIGADVTTDRGWHFVVIAEHQHRPWRASPSYATPAAAAQLPVDDVKQAFDTLVMLLERPRQRGQLEALLGNVVSRLKNHAQVQLLRSARWAEEALETEDQGDAERSGYMEGIAAALSWVGDELVALMGRNIKGRHVVLRPFDFPAAWQKDPPTAEDLRPLSPEEQEASDGFDAAKREREEEFHAQGGERREQGGAQ